MNKVKHFFGIDISKDVFDVFKRESGHRQFENSSKDFKSFLKELPKNAHCLMKNDKLRNILFMRSFKAVKYNKLLTQAFAVVKRGVNCDKIDAAVEIN